MQVELRSALEALGHYAVWGAIELESCAGCTLELDGRVLAGAEGPVRLSAIRGGLRKLRLLRSGNVVLTCTIGVRAGQVAKTTPGVCEAAPPPAPVVVPVLKWGGLGVAAIGVALIGWGAAVAASGPDQICLRREDDRNTACASLGLPTFGFDGDPGIAIDPDAVNPSGVPIAALGAGFLTTGVAIGAGAFAIDDDSSWWIPVGAGLLLGAVAGTVTAVAGAR